VRAEGGTWNSSACAAAAGGGHLELLARARANGCLWGAPAFAEVRPVHRAFCGRRSYVIAGNTSSIGARAGGARRAPRGAAVPARERLPVGRDRDQLCDGGWAPRRPAVAPATGRRATQTPHLSIFHLRSSVQNILSGVWMTAAHGLQRRWLAAEGCPCSWATCTAVARRGSLPRGLRGPRFRSGFSMEHEARDPVQGSTYSRPAACQARPRARAGVAAGARPGGRPRDVQHRRPTGGAQLRCRFRN
jgi:hypothetical protein